MIDRGVRLARAGSPTASMVLLVAFNLIPLAGVLLGGWNVATLLVLYWVENGIVGILNVPKMLLARGRPASPPLAAPPFARPTGVPPTLSRYAVVPFFLVHYGLFWFVHGIFVFVLPRFAGLGEGLAGSVLGPGAAFGGPSALATTGSATGPDMSAVALGAVGLAISHGASFVMNFLGRREYLTVSPAAQMFAPYRRLIILHVTIVIGAFVSLMIGSPIGAIVVLVLLKMAIDLALHRREHATS